MPTLAKGAAIVSDACRAASYGIEAVHPAPGPASAPINRPLEHGQPVAAPRRQEAPWHKAHHSQLDTCDSTMSVPSNASPMKVQHIGMRAQAATLHYDLIFGRCAGSPQRSVPGPGKTLLRHAMRTVSTSAMLALQGASSTNRIRAWPQR